MRWLVAAIALLVSWAPATAGEKRIALTFDDAPRQAGPFFTPEERTTRLIAGLKKARVRQAAFFVVPGRVGQRDGVGGGERIIRYISAGHVVANHSFSHPHLSQMSAADYLADVDRAEDWTRQLSAYRNWFRFPYLDEGGKDKTKRDAVRSGLRARGLNNGYVTADGNDWQIEDLVAKATKAGRNVDRSALRQFYVESMVGAANYYNELAVRAWGRSPIHILLLHETDIAALYIADMVKALRKDGWTIVTADEAYADPIAALAPDAPSANGTRTELAAWEKGLPAPRWYARNNEQVMERDFNAEVLGIGASAK